MVTDGQGKFALKGLDPQLLFTVVVAAKGHVSAERGNVDPRSGSLDLALLPHDLDRRDPARIVSGLVLDENGKPVANAAVRPTGYGNEGTTYAGLVAIADRLAVTDDRGRFRIGLAKRVDALYVTVTAPFLAPRQSGPLPAGPKPNEIKLVQGVTVFGKVVKGGKPLGGVTLRLAQDMGKDAERKRDRAMLELRFEIDTDAEGNFRFLNVPPEEDFVLIGVMESFRPHGALKARKLLTKENLTTCDLGTLPAQPGFRLAGRVVLADGKAVPKGTQVVFYRREDAAYDLQRTTAGPDGSFELTGIPDELCQLSVSVKGYCVSRKNYSCDSYHGHGLYGRVDRDITDLRFLLEPGAFSPRQIGDKDADALIRRRGERLQGALTAELEKGKGGVKP